MLAELACSLKDRSPLFLTLNDGPRTRHPQNGFFDHQC